MFKLLVALLLIVLIAAIVWELTRTVTLPVVGETAPDFKLQGQDGKTHQLADYHGHWLVLYFYPKDDTPGCTREACRFRDDISALHALNAAVVGVSLDDPSTHAAFARKHHLPFPLLSDATGKTAAAYGSLLNLGVMRLAKRRSFIIGPDGHIAAVFSRVDPNRHSSEVAQTLQKLRQPI